ncbi:MAG: ribonuclease E inhibitor RraB [bacterium]|nr:ribonuclease E inhibitor RraB [bacterium]
MDRTSREQKRTNRELNSQHLAALERDGSNLGVAHTTCHQFEMQDDISVGILRSLLLGSGFHVLKVSKQPLAEPGKVDFHWRLEAELKVIPMLPSLHEMTDYCCDLARMANADYHGWYAQPVKNQ